MEMSARSIRCAAAHRVRSTTLRSRAPCDAETRCTAASTTHAMTLLPNGLSWGTY